MPDITMCMGANKITSCPLKDKCKRHTAKASARQSYFCNIPFTLTDSTKGVQAVQCEHYWKMIE